MLQQLMNALLGCSATCALITFCFKVSRILTRYPFGKHRLICLICLHFARQKIEIKDKDYF